MACLRTCAVSLLLLGLAMSEGTTDNLEYVGCFESTYSLIKDYQHRALYSNLGKCVTLCRYLGSPRYIGISSRDNLCYCGGDIAQKASKVTDNLCVIECSDTKNRTCGGYEQISLYTQKINNTKPDVNVSLSFLVATTSEVRVYTPTTLTKYDTVFERIYEWNELVDFHYTKRLVFTIIRNQLLRVEVTPTFDAATATPSVVRNVSESCDWIGFAVDWVADKIYGVDCDPGSQYIIKTDLDGSHQEVVVTLDEPRSIRKMEVDPYSRMLFWSANRGITSLNLTSHEYRTLVKGDKFIIQDITLDRSAQRLYFIAYVDLEIKTLYSIDYTGGQQVKMFSLPQMKEPRGFAVHGGFAYWVNREFYGGIAMPTSIIYRTPIQVEGGHSVQTLQLINQTVWDMRILHPDVQKPSSLL